MNFLMFRNFCPLNFLPGQRIFVYDIKKNLFYRSANNYSEPDKSYLNEIDKKGEISFRFDNDEFAGFTFVHRKNKYYVIIGAIDESGISKINYLRILLIRIFFISFILTGFLGWIFARRSLKPMVQVNEEVDQITATNLHKRVKVLNNKDEIAHLAKTFNSMLDRIESSFMMQKNFVSNASHEFRTPLTSMKGQIEVLLMQDRSEEEYVQSLTSLNEDVNNFIKLLQGLSDLAKVNVDFMEKAYETISIVDILLDTREELIRNKPKYTIQLHFEKYTEDDKYNSIKGNSALIKSAITNLMDNACKFSPNFNVNVKVSFGDHIIIKFSDEGIGISNDELPHIFEPFYRGNDTRNISGHGIGLSLVNRIIEIHHGTIKVESSQGEGTTFIISLPVLAITESTNLQQKIYLK